VFWNGERVRVPLSTVARVQERRFAPAKTIAFGGALLGGLLLAAEAFMTGSDGGGSGGGGGYPVPQ